MSKRLWQAGHRPDRMDAVVTLLFLLMGGVSIFASSRVMTDPYILPKWCYTCGAGLLWLLVWSGRLMQGGGPCLDRRWAGCGMALLCTLEALWGIGQGVGWLPSAGVHRVTGSFDNPAGFAACLCAGLPLTAYWRVVTEKRWGHVVAGVSVALMAAGIVWSGSRSGVMAVATMAVMWGWRQVPLSARQKSSLLAVAMVLLLGGMYLLKKDSADGRLLIWQCAWNMVEDAPLLGHGPGSFRAHYMDYQAAWLAAHPDSPYARLADNVLSPFNEYLHLLLNFGALGLLACLGFAGWLLWENRRHMATDRECRMAVAVLGDMAVFSFFSYPFTYPFTWIAVLFAVGLLLRPMVRTRTCTPLYRRLAGMLLAVLCAAAAFLLGRRVDAEWRWGRIAYGDSMENLETYARLMPVLGKEPYFLYNYAATLLDAHQPKQSLMIARRCRQYWADYDLELLTGIACERQGLYGQAEACYEKAGDMCPSRFMPLYRLYELYKATGNKERMRQAAQQIVDKPMKVRSREILRMKRKVKREVLEINH